MLASQPEPVDDEDRDTDEAGADSVTVRPYPAPGSHLDAEDFKTRAHEVSATVTDVKCGPGDQLPDLFLLLPAERARQMTGVERHLSTLNRQTDWPDRP